MIALGIRTVFKRNVGWMLLFTGRKPTSLEIAFYTGSEVSQSQVRAKEDKTTAVGRLNILRLLLCA